MPGTPLRAHDPARVGPYALTARLGEGGQGVVYLGEAPDGTRVAVKVLHARFSGDARMRARFAGELASARRVAPFCTARILDADVEGDIPYLVGEFIAGPSLREVVDTAGPRTGAELQRLAIGTVTALTAIHEAGIVHRDFKPSNVLLASDGPRVIDFGIARALDATGTLSSTAVGTPSYMSPEQIAGEKVGPATDVFAWGCTIVFAATGSPPFGQDSIPAVMNRILHHEPALGMLMGPLREIVGECLAKDPGRRPAAQRILLRLLGAAGALPVNPRPGPHTTVLEQGAQAAAAAEAPPAAAAVPAVLEPAPDPAGDGVPPVRPPFAPQAPAGDPPWPSPGPASGDTPWPPARPPSGDPPPVPYGAPPAGAPGGDPAPSPARRRRTHPAIPVAIAAGMVVVVAAGTITAVRLLGHHSPEKKNTTTTGRAGGTFRMAMYAPDAIDPSNAGQNSDLFAVENLFTGLNVIKPDGSVAPALATRSEPNADCTRWRFTIRQGTRFTDGRPVDATAFVRGWSRAARSTSGAGYLMSGIEGYAAVASGRRTAMTGVTAEGAATLDVRLTAPDCDFATRVAAPVFAPVPPSAGGPDDKAYDARPIGNGPYKVGQYVPNSRLTLVRNDSYAFAKPKLDSVDVTLTTDLDQALTGFDAGRYDWAELSSTSMRTALSRHATDGRLLKSADATMTYLLPVGDKGRMTSVNARQAVSYALDRAALVKTVFQGAYPAATSLLPPGVPGAVAAGCAACTADPARAKDLAARAGLGPGTKVTLTASSTGTNPQVAGVVRDRLRAVLGWDVTLRTLRIDQVITDMAGKSAHDLYVFSWAADYPSAANYLDALLSGGAIQAKGDGSIAGSNYARYRSSAFDAAMKSALSTPDAKRRAAYLRDAQNIALRDMALIPLYPHTDYRVADTRSFVGVRTDYLGYPTLVTAARR